MTDDEKHKIAVHVARKIETDVAVAWAKFTKKSLFHTDNSAYQEKIASDHAAEYVDANARWYLTLVHRYEQIDEWYMATLTEVVNAASGKLPGPITEGVMNARLSHWRAEALAKVTNADAEKLPVLSDESINESAEENPNSTAILATESELAAERQKRLTEYKSATKIPSNRKIYTAKNSGIHKPQFYEWLRGKLPAGSHTTINFERFLREKKPPIPKGAR